MTISVGILYSSQNFLELLSKTPISTDEFSQLFNRLESVSGEHVLAMAQHCEWIEVQPTGRIGLTARGQAVLKAVSPSHRLRLQISDYVLLRRPAWCVNLRNGRKEAELAIPPDVRQCLNEAGLLDGLSDEVQAWWSFNASVGRFVDAERKRDAGRDGEKLSLEYEAKRTGIAPYWQAFESNFAGYDIQSVTQRGSTEPLLIEVKSCQTTHEQGTFYVTRGEWETARESPHYVFHLWAMKPTPSLIVVTPTELGAHVPADKEGSKWTHLEVKMRQFLVNSRSGG